MYLIRGLRRLIGKPKLPDPLVDQARLVRDVKHICDVGANAGNTVERYRHLFPSATIHALEPHPTFAEYLRTRFSGDPAVTILERAATDHIGTTNLNLSPKPRTHSLMSPVGYVPTGTTVVQSLTLDSLDIPFDLLKIDVEGSESFVLRGADRLLTSLSVRAIMLEIFFIQQYVGQALHYALATQLADYGYHLYRLYDLKYVKETGQLRYGNALFLPFRQ
jgi:FkbM family methyltransferase